MRQVIVGGASIDPVSSTATEYISIYKRESHTWTATENNRRQMVPGNGIVHSMKIVMSSAAGAGAYTFTLRLNGADTSQTVVVTHPATSAEITTAETVITAGQYWTLESTPSGSPTLTPSILWEFIVESTGDVNRCMITGGHQNPVDVSFTEFNTVAGGTTWSINTAGNNNVEIPMPLSGTFKNLYVEISGAAGVGSNHNIALRLGGSVILSVPLADPTTSGSDTDSATCTAGQLVDMRSNPTGLPTARYAWWGVEFESDEPYFYPVLCNSEDQPLTGEFNSLFSSGANWNATEALMRVSVKQGAYKNLYICAGTAPGAGETATLTVYKNGVATALTVTLSDTATVAGETTIVLETIDSDQLSVEFTKSAASAVTDIGWSVAQYTYNPWMYSAREGNMGN